MRTMARLLKMGHDKSTARMISFELWLLRKKGIILTPDELIRVAIRSFRENREL